MQTLLSNAVVPRPHRRPILDSYDSGDEFSLHHWIDVCKLVNEANDPSLEEGIVFSPEFEDALQETMSEVEPATAYQHFAGNVV